MKALILAAGYGTRLYPLTKHTPKPLLMIQGKPIINHLLKKIEESGCIREVFVVSNDKFYPHFTEWLSSAKDMFQALAIRVMNDGSTSPEDRKGAIGDVAFVIGEAGIAEDILVIGGDNYFDQGLKEFIAFSQAGAHKATLGLFDIKEKKEASKFGVVTLGRNKQVISFQEKPAVPDSSTIAMCLYYFSTDTFGLIEEYLAQTETADTTGEFIKWLSAKIPVYGFLYRGAWDDIGHIDSLCNWDKGYYKYKEERRVKK